MKNTSSSHPSSSSLTRGFFWRRLPYFESTALILSGTIGAGILGLPYAVAQVGIGLGILCIFLFGFLTFGLNLLIAEVASSTGRPLQLVGLAKEYLGPLGGVFMFLIMYSLLFGVLLIYLIGEGESLAALFGGKALHWTLLFFSIMTSLVILGMKTVKLLEMILIFCVLTVVLFIIWTGFPHIQIENITYVRPLNILVLYSILMFAFHSTTAIPEAQSILKNKNVIFKRSIFTATLVCIAVYSLFSLAVVGVTGENTTGLATIGLGYQVGPFVKILGNLFAALAMGTGFLMAASSLRDSLKWDFSVSQIPAALIVCFVPLLFYLFGIRQFILVMDIVGGVFISFQMLLVVFIYWRARHMGKVAKRGKFLHHALFASSVVFAAFLLGTIYTVLKYI